MSSWDDVINLFTSPYFIGLLLVSGAIHPSLKYLRRFYPEKMKKAAYESEKLEKEIAGDSELTALTKKVKMVEFKLIFLPSIIVYIIYIAYKVFTGSPLTPFLVLKDAIVTAMAPVMFISIGLTSIYHDKVTRFMLKDDYQKYMDLVSRSTAADPTEKFFLKYMHKFGYVFIVLGIAAPIAVYFNG